MKIAREAREAARHEVLIAGSIGPPGVFRDPREATPEHLQSIFREQAEALEERGVDFFVLETFGNPAELLAAVDAVRSFSLLPIVAELTYSEEGITFNGTRPKDAWSLLQERGVQVIGANCSVGPQDHLRTLQELAAVAGSFPMSAMPNVGFPQRAGDRVIYPKSSPEYFDLFAREAVVMGARILGGCCGTSPEHIRAMVRAVEGMRATTKARAVSVVDDRRKPAPSRPARRKARCGERFRRRNSWSPWKLIRPKRHFDRSRFGAGAKRDGLGGRRH